LRDPYPLPHLAGTEAVASTGFRVGEGSAGEVRGLASAQIQSHDSAHPCEDRPESGIEPMGGEPSV
jgi:hypothetical protein